MTRNLRFGIHNELPVRSHFSVPTIRVDDFGFFCDYVGIPVALKYPHIIKRSGDSARLENHPRTRATMIVLDYLWRGWSAEEMIRKYPYLTLAEIHAALTCFFDHQEEIEAELAAEYQDVTLWRQNHPTPLVLQHLKSQALH